MKLFNFNFISSISMIVNKLIEEGNVDDAIKLLKNTEDSGKITNSTIGLKHYKDT